MLTRRKFSVLRSAPGAGNGVCARSRREAPDRRRAGAPWKANGPDTLNGRDSAGATRSLSTHGYDGRGRRDRVVIGRRP